jgi:hypothetical protein
LGLKASIDSTNFEREPVQEMLQGGVIADVVDLGLKDDKFNPGKKKHKCYLMWILDEVDSNGRNKRAFQNFTVSLHEKARLRKFVESLGFKLEKGVEFEFDNLIGVKRFLVLSQEDSKSGGDPFLQITATMALKKGQSAPDVPADFVRKQDQPAK